MATIKNFEELVIWQKAQDLAILVYKICISNEYIAKDFSFKDQIKRAAFSISNNIAEGFEYNNNSDFIRFLKYSKGSCGEVKNCLLFAKRMNFINEDEAKELIEKANEISFKIGSLISYLKTKVKKPATRNS